MERGRPAPAAGAASPTRRTPLSTEPTTANDGAERRLAILFTDVEGSTQLRSTRGDAAADPERARAMLDDAASAYGAIGMPSFEALARSVAARA